MAYSELEIDTSEFEGMAELLDKFPQEVQDKMIKQSLGAGAAVLMLGVMEKTPVRAASTGKTTALDPGMLKADIHAVASKSGRAWYIGAGPRTAHVMRWLERGHLLVRGGQIAWSNGKRNRRGSGGKVVDHVPAYPVLRPAFDEFWKTALKATSAELGARISAYWSDTVRRVKRAA